MGKLANLASVLSANLDSFVYTPPDSAYRASRVLVLANLGYALGSSPAVNWGTLSAVLRGLRRFTPNGRILIVDKICPAESADAIFARSGLAEALDSEMRVAPSDLLAQKEYDNPLNPPLTHAHITAPAYLTEFDSVINITTFEATPHETKAGITSLYQWLACDSPVKPTHGTTRHHDIYHTLARFIHHSVVEVRVKHDTVNVVWGSQMLAVDRVAAQMMNVSADYLNAL